MKVRFSTVVHTWKGNYLSAMQYLSLRAKTALSDSLRVELDGVIGKVEPVRDRHQQASAKSELNKSSRRTDDRYYGVVSAFV